MTKPTNPGSALGQSDDRTAFVYLSSSQAKQRILTKMARQFKGIDPDIDRKIDAAAASILGQDIISSAASPRAISADLPGSPRAPLYFEGEPGVSKTTIFKDAAREFCDLVGLNLVDVDKAPPGWLPGPKDFVFGMVNLSGQMNASSLGGLPMRTSLDAGGAASRRARASQVGWDVAQRVADRLAAIAKFSGKLDVQSVTFDDGPLSCAEIRVKGERAPEAVRSVVSEAADEAKKMGTGVSMIAADAPIAEDRVTYSISGDMSDGVVLRINSPRPANADEEFVMATLPNVRFALASKCKFGLFMFDDVANAHESVRNVLLEVAQNSRYSGLIDLGNALVCFTGNIGAADNTNVMSKQSDAELTRVEKYRIEASPGDVCNYFTRRYADSAVGDCYMATFVSRVGADPGILRTNRQEKAGQRGVPKTNARALENALSQIRGYFLDALAVRENPMVMFGDAIRRVVSATAGSYLSARYVAFLRAAMSDAQPLASEVIFKGKLDQARFNKHSGDGAFRTNEEVDFGFRFSAALADEALYRIAFLENDSGSKNKSDSLEQRIVETISNLTVGLEALSSKPDLMAFCASRFGMRSENIPAFQVSIDASAEAQLKDSFHGAFHAIGAGFEDALTKGKSFSGDKEAMIKCKTSFAACVTAFKSGTSAAPVVKVKKPGRNPSSS